MNNPMKKIAVVGTVGIPACYGGFESLVQNLVDYQSEDVTYTVFCSSKHYKNKPAHYKNARLEYISLKANGASSIFYDIYSLFRCLKEKHDVVLILGVSGCVVLPIFRLFSHSKIVTNIDGLEWRREKWGRMAKSFIKFSEKLSVFSSDVVISDNHDIGDYVKSEYNKNNQVIAYGGEHALIKGRVVPDQKSDFYLSLCRIEPENNVSMILESFAGTPYKLKFVVNWNNSEYGLALKNKYSKFDNIEIIDPIYDISVLFDLRSQCKGYVHGHSAGGTNPSLVEAMQFGMDILAFDCNFNRYTTEDKAHYFSSSNHLREIIENIESSVLPQSGKDMAEIAYRRYQWSEITRLYEQTYN